MSSAQIVSATALQPVAGSGTTDTGRSVLPPVLYSHMSQPGMHYPAYSSSGVGQSLQVIPTCTGLCVGLPDLAAVNAVCVMSYSVYKLKIQIYQKYNLDSFRLISFPYAE